MSYYYLTFNFVPSNGIVGTPLYRTIYGMNWHGIELRKAVIQNPNASTLEVVCTSKKLDANGKVIEERPAESHALVTTNTLLKQFLNPYNGSSWANDTATLESNKGIILVTEYNSVTNKKSGSKVKIGSGGTAYYISATDYNAEGHISAQYIYPTQTTNRNASDRVTTNFTYTYWENNFKQAIKTKTETKQAVPVTQNGNGVSAVTQTYYDSYNNIRWTRDPLGVVTYYGYHPVTTQRTLTVRDVDTGSLPAIVTTDTDNIAAWTGNVPFTREISLPTAFNQTITTEYDKRGRVFASTNPAGVPSYTVYGVRKTMRFSAWDETTQQPTLPIDITETNAAGKILESYQLPPTAVTVTNGKPSGVSSGSAKVSWARYTYNSSGSPLHVDRYHVIPASGVGSVGTNFYRTTVIYDTQGRQAATVQFAQTGKWQVDYQIYDWRNRVVEIKRGVAMNPPVLGDLSGATWLKTISKIIYSGERVDKELYYFDTGTNDYTGVKYYYDEWNRVRSAPSFAIINGTETLLAPFTVQDYDWRGNVVDVAQFEVEPNWNTIATNSNFAATATGKFSHNRSSYDIQGRVWKTNVFNNVSNSFDETMYKYNFAGQRISTTHNNTSVESNYDSLGRNIESKMKSGMVVKMIQRQEYDITGNVIGKESLTLNPNETTSINENGTNFVRRTVYNWYDKAGRQMVSADFGSGAVIWTNAAKPARPNIIPENSSEDCLVTKYGFSPTTGQVENATDTKGIITQIFYDTLDRETKKVLNFVDSGTAADENVEVQYVFDGLNNTVTQTVINPTTDNQVTKYLYEDSYDASLQTSAIYPDSSDTNSNGTDQVKNTYHLDGNIKTQTDQNGNVRTFSYDAYRRRIADSVTTVGTGVDGAVRKIAQTYTTQGALEKVSSMDSTNAVLNEVKYEYDANLKLKKLQQSYSNAVTTSTPYLEYSYDSANDNRLTGVVYPSGKVIGYSYDSFDNITSINEGTTPLVSYIYDGSGSPMQTVYNQPNISLTYANGGLDRYGRIINHSWVNNNSALVHIVHGYDYAGNRLYRNDLIQSANSELYTYDNLGQIKTLSRGILNNDQTAITTINHSESWNFDKTGNWLQYINNGTIENRTHNAANELLGIATHDANGNMTLMPGLKGKYDAWNRLVEVRDTSDNLIATYEYNGLNQRIKKTIGSTVTKSFFNEKWQELESQTGAEITSYVWGVRYIDDLVLREKDNERLYSLADPNWNVVSLIDSTGSVVEQLKYDAFGKITWLDNNFSAKNGSDYNCPFQKNWSLIFFVPLV